MKTFQFPQAANIPTRRCFNDYVTFSCYVIEKSPSIPSQIHPRLLASTMKQILTPSVSELVGTNIPPPPHPNIKIQCGDLFMFEYL